MHSDPLCRDISDSCRQTIAPGSSVLLAISGGADSVAMFHLLLGLKQELAFSRLGIAHVNHGLRSQESNAEEHFVSSLAENAAVPFHCKHLCGKHMDDPALEEWARKERYSFFRKTMKEKGYDYCATAHTADDQAETVLMRLARGTGIKGLRGILPVREDNIVRPMLAISRQRIEKWLAEQGHQFHIDRSNDDTRFRRNMIRHTVLPALSRNNPVAIDHIAQIAAQAHSTWAVISERINNWIIKNVVEYETNTFTVKKQGFSDTYCAQESLAELFRRKSISLARRHIAGITRNSTKISGTWLLPGKWHYFPEKEHIIFSKGPLPEQIQRHFCYTLSFPGSFVFEDRGVNLAAKILDAGTNAAYTKSDNFTVFLDAHLVPEIVEYRTLEKDDIFRPLGYHCSMHAVKYLKNRKLDTAMRNSATVIAAKDNRIIWIPGMQISDDFRITAKTTSILKISFKKVP
ncbi:MAG: tRNA lysidine(34) synthetase TilS [Chitinivibrionales bacterium]|nr:tRNA lysidine(34) synthetase TilS [Chitinivibrionales bacterium]